MMIAAVGVNPEQSPALKMMKSRARFADANHRDSNQEASEPVLIRL
jgi:hypothetical protein